MLFTRFLVFNLVCGSLIGAAWYFGLVSLVIENDPSRISWFIVGIFVLCLYKSFMKAYQISTELQRIGDSTIKVKGYTLRFADLVSGGLDARMAAEALRVKLHDRISFIRNVGNILVGFGLAGTIVGFGISFEGVSASSVSSIEGVQSLVVSFLSGVGVALYTTLVGLIFSAWTMVNYTMLYTASSNLYASILEEFSGLSQAKRS